MAVARESSVVTVYAAPQLAFNKTALNVGRGFRTSSSELIISRNVGGTPVPLSEPVTVALTSSDPSKVSVPATVTISPGLSFEYVIVTGVELTAGTPVTITASAQNYQSPPSGVTVTVVPPVFALCNVNTTRVTVSPRDDAQVCGRHSARLRTRRCPGNQYDGRCGSHGCKSVRHRDGNLPRSQRSLGANLSNHMVRRKCG